MFVKQPFHFFYIRTRMMVGFIAGCDAVRAASLMTLHLADGISGRFLGGSPQGALNPEGDDEKPSTGKGKGCEKKAPDPDSDAGASR
jgi:hypothetical protein